MGSSRAGSGAHTGGALMPYGVTGTAKGLTARWSLWGWMLWRRTTACVWERPLLIHTASARDAAEFRQSVVMPVIVRLWVASDTLAGGGADAGDDVVIVEGAGLAPRIVSVLGLLGGGVHTCVFGLLVAAVRCVEGGWPGGGVVEGGCGRSFRVAHVYRVVAAAPSACMVNRSSCWRRVTRTFGAVSSYTCVVWGRWLVTVILAASFLQVVVWGMM